MVGINSKIKSNHFAPNPDIRQFLPVVCVVSAAVRYQKDLAEKKGKGKQLFSIPFYSILAARPTLLQF